MSALWQMRETPLWIKDKRVQIIHLDLCCKTLMQKEKAAAMLLHLLTKAGPTQTKIDYIRFKIMDIILYTAQVST
jgi:hypothetical protein